MKFSDSKIKRDHSVAGRRANNRLPQQTLVPEAVIGEQVTTRYPDLDIRRLASWWARHAEDLEDRDALATVAAAPTPELAHAFAYGLHSHHALWWFMNFGSHPRCACGSLAVSYWRRRGHKLPVCRDHYSQSGRRIAEKMLIEQAPGYYAASIFPDAPHPDLNDPADFAHVWISMGWTDGYGIEYPGPAEYLEVIDIDLPSWATMTDDYLKAANARRRAAASNVGKSYHAGGPPRIDDHDQVAEARRLIAKGLKAYEAAEEVGMTPSRLSRRLKEIRSKETG